jgi:hypothetical protein
MTPQEEIEMLRAENERLREEKLEIVIEMSRRAIAFNDQLLREMQPEREAREARLRRAGLVP